MMRAGIVLVGIAFALAAFTAWLAIHRPPFGGG